MDTPSITDFPDDLDRLAEWGRRRAAEEGRRPLRGTGGTGGCNGAGPALVSGGDKPRSAGRSGGTPDASGGRGNANPRRGGQ